VKWVTRILYRRTTSLKVFFIRFLVTIDNMSPNVPADGFSFIVHQDPLGCNAVGQSGQGVGYAGIKNALVVEFDTYDNAVNNDPNSDHIGVQISPSNGAAVDSVHGSPSTLVGAIALPMGGDPLNVELYPAASDTNFDLVHIITIEYSGLTAEISVNMDGNPLVKRQSTNSLVNILNLNNAYIGFGASTGLFVESVSISNFRLVSPYP